MSCNCAKRETDKTDIRNRDKLVRDRIPAKIRAGGREPKNEELHGKALTSALRDKLVEVTAGFQQAISTGKIPDHKEHPERSRQAKMTSLSPRVTTS